METPTRITVYYKHHTINLFRIIANEYGLKDGQVITDRMVFRAAIEKNINYGIKLFLALTDSSN